MKKQIEVKMFGLNELGVQETNEFYKGNIESNYCRSFKLDGHYTSKRTKRIKQIKGFGPETVLYTIDLASKPSGDWFRVKVKHVKCEIYEIVETSTRIS